jgi:hypothetical protein
VGGFPAFSAEVPMVDWCSVFSENNGHGTAFFASDIHGCDHADSELRLTLLRAIPYADHHPFPRNDQTGFQEMGNTFIELWLCEGENLSGTTLPRRARARLTQAEVLEVTCHDADPDAFCVPAPCPVANELPEVVTEAMYLNDSAEWEIHLMNHGSAVTLPLPDGTVKDLPARALTVLKIPAV